MLILPLLIGQRVDALFDPAVAGTGTIMTDLFVDPPRRECGESLYGSSGSQSDDVSVFTVSLSLRLLLIVLLCCRAGAWECWGFTQMTNGAVSCVSAVKVPLLR